MINPVRFGPQIIPTAVYSQPLSPVPLQFLASVPARPQQPQQAGNRNTLFSRIHSIDLNGSLIANASSIMGGWTGAFVGVMLPIFLGASIPVILVASVVGLAVGAGGGYLYGLAAEARSSNAG